MKQLLTASVCAFALIAGAASANAAATAAQDQNTPGYAKPVIADADAMKGADEMQHTSLRQQLLTQLEKAGYTQVKIMPSSFYVQAKDKKGDPVAMVIGPDSFAEVTDVAHQPPAAAAQNAPNGAVQQK